MHTLLFIALSGKVGDWGMSMLTVSFLTFLDNFNEIHAHIIMPTLLAPYSDKSVHPSIHLCVHPV